MAAKGYPALPAKGGRISNLDAAAQEGAVIFHAGTAEKDGALVANGGRVLAVTALGATVADASDIAYAAVKKVDWADGFYRTDIGWRAIAREEGAGE